MSYAIFRVEPINKLKDFFSGVSYGKKIKTKFSDNKNPNTITPYSTNLVFEKIKLLLRQKIN